MAMEWSERIGRRIRLRDLHILLAVAQCRSIAKAAKHLAVSQPVVSKVIGDLEHTIGVRLFDRDRYGAQPTVYGAALLKRGVAAFDELRHGLKDIEFLVDPTAGEVWVGGTEAMFAGIIPAVINQLYSQYPRLVIHLTQLLASPTLYQELRERNVDFVFGRMLGQTIEKDLTAEILFDEPIAVAAGLQNRWVRRRRIALAELINEPWILPRPDTLAGALVADAFHACDLEVPRAAVICGFVHMTSTLLSTGPFVTMLPCSFLRFSSQRLSIKTLPVSLSLRPGPVGLVTLKGRTLSPAALLVIDCVRKVVKPLAGNK
jgi:DNA-binding transcriptional LysR family regulator